MIRAIPEVEQPTLNPCPITKSKCLRQYESYLALDKIEHLAEKNNILLVSDGKLIGKIVFF